MKQVVLSMIAVMIAAAIFAGMVFYSIGVIRSAQMRILTGEITAVTVR